MPPGSEWQTRKKCIDARLTKRGWTLMPPRQRSSRAFGSNANDAHGVTRRKTKAPRRTSASSAAGQEKGQSYLVIRHPSLLGRFDQRLHLSRSRPDKFKRQGSTRKALFCR